ncbi:MAG: hypothetical protein OXB93_03090 [Cytophagales bacterium]|nr:hypothetical protein [Cytophagales bacterium]
MILLPLIYVIYAIRLLLASGYKNKYDFASRYATPTLRLIGILMSIGLAASVNLWAQDAVSKEELWFFIRLAISFPIGGIWVYLSFSFLNFYYPKVLYKRLNKYRYAPRTNPSTGNKMRLLSEDEEDKYLDEGMQAEEDAFSVDYDVWLDEQTNEVIIEKYKGNLIAEECDCGFQTLKLVNQEIVQDPDDASSNVLKKHYLCSYCGEEVERFVQTRRSLEKTEQESLAEQMSQQILSLKLEIFRKDGRADSYEFQNVHQTQDFLKQINPTQAQNPTRKTS